MTDLTTVTAVAAMLHITEPDDNTLLSLLVSQASQMFETETRRTFSSSTGTLTYDLLPPTTFGRKLFFDTDIIGVDRLVNGDGTDISSSNYRLLPLNQSPKYAVELFMNSGVYWQMTSANQWQSAVQVMGTMGYCLTGHQPADVTYAVTKLAAWLYQTRDNSGDMTRFADGSIVIPANAPQVVMMTADKYRRARIYT